MNNMKKTVILVALLALAGAPAAVAQTGTGSGASKSSGGLPQAPVGHRQPRAGDVPSEKNLASDSISKEDAILDKKIKSICRGC